MTFLAGFAAGYVVGARAGRERYEQIASAGRTLMSNPKVQQTTDMAKHQAADLAETAKSQAAGLADTAKTRVHDKIEERRSGGDDSSGSMSGSSTSPSTMPTGAADDSVFVVDLNDHVGTGTGPTGTNDRMGL
ncbi:YtxH domain-containing protein [Motilibacter peucedani]|nr:YtxH domain-containing protein [Motilibacter peucedani]